MRTFRTVVAASLTAILAVSTSAFAQERHAVSPAAVAQAVAQRVAQQDTDRSTIRQALARPEVAQVAATVGIDLARVTSAIDSLSPSELATVAAQAQQVNQPLVGGASTVTISTTTIIIALLIIILVVIAD